MAARVAQLRWMALAVVLGGCGRSGERTPGATSLRSAARGGAVVATVEGRAIALDEVRALASDGGLSPEAALRRLEAERLLMAEAERRGDLDVLPEVADVARRAGVQALLDAETRGVQVTDEEVRAAYEKSRDRFEVAERRRAVHALVPLEEGAPAALDTEARDYAERTLAALRASPDPSGVLAAQAGRTVRGIPVVVESLPPLARNGALVASFETAMFEVPGVGVAAAPVRTRYGWHALAVVEVIPGSVTPYETAARVLREELTTERKKARVDALLAELQARHPVRVPQDVKQSLGQLEL